jgi:sigma-B regulation protein RsbU (phosphoserine phosphatase)
MIEGTTYSQTAVQLDPGDLLLLYTDGISESCDETGEQLGLDGLLTIARDLPVDSAVAAGRALLAAVERFRGSVPPADDETVVALERALGVEA